MNSSRGGGGLDPGVRLQRPAFAGTPGLQCLAELRQQARSKAVQAGQTTIAHGRLQVRHRIDAQFLVQQADPFRPDERLLQ